MPTPSTSRLNSVTTPSTSGSSYATPVRSKSPFSGHSARASTSYTPTVVSNGQQQRINVVTRVAIEGRAKQGQDGATVKMYLKVFNYWQIGIAQIHLKFNPDCCPFGLRESGHDCALVPW
jgi:hypothetical protein